MDFSERAKETSGEKPVIASNVVVCWRVIAAGYTVFYNTRMLRSRNTGVNRGQRVKTVYVMLTGTVTIFILFLPTVLLIVILFFFFCGQVGS